MFRTPSSFGAVSAFRGLCLLAGLLCRARGSDTAVRLWQIGAFDRRPAEFALFPGGHGEFLAHFGRPENAFYIGLSDPATDWPCVLPGPVDTWAGSHYNPKAHNQWDHMNTLPIGFVLTGQPSPGNGVLTLALSDVSPSRPPRLRIAVNGHFLEQALAAGGSEASLSGDLAQAKPQTVQIRFPAVWLVRGYNEVSLRSLSGSWCLFDALACEVPGGCELAPPSDTVLRAVSALPYAVSGSALRPATVRLEVFQARGPGGVQAQFDDQPAVALSVGPGLQWLDVPAPVAASGGGTRVRVVAAGKTLYDQGLQLAPSPAATPADYVNPFLGTAHSRWMIAPGPWMPFGMVKLAPDNQPGSWCAGYDYGQEHIDCFSHLHEFTMAGLGMMPTVGPVRTHPGFDAEGFSSRIDKATEQGGIGFYRVWLEDPHIAVELTATRRASLQRYTFPASDQARVALSFLLPNEYEMHVVSAHVRRVGMTELEGDIQTDIPDMYRCDQHYVLHFVSQFDRPFESLGAWQNLAGAQVTIPRGNFRPLDELKPGYLGQVLRDIGEFNGSGDCGAFVTFRTRAAEAIEVRTGLSLVSVRNARLNLTEELVRPFGWDFAAVVAHQRREWNELFGRIQIETPDAREKMRFYSNFYRALAGRNTWSDVNGEWVDSVGQVRTQKQSGGFMMSSDALWGTFWNLNPLMNLAAPEWAQRWVNSELAMYDDAGWLAKGPAGLKYISIMVAEHEIPLLVAAYQSGVKGLDGPKILEAAVRMQTALPQRVPGGGRAGNENLAGYLKYGYVPADGPMRGNVSNTLEYAYDDWTVGQLARKLGRTEVADQFLRRSENWRKVLDPQSGFVRPRLANGDWLNPFDPYHTKGYTESNAWQYTLFVPQDIPGLVEALGQPRFVGRLNSAFAKMASTRFNAAGGLSGEYPINQGNEPAMQAPWLFNWAGAPWLTQQWTRAVLDSFYGYNPADAYPGDDDQGELSSWFVLSSLGLFQTDGGCDAQPVYELSSPLYSKITLRLSAEHYGGHVFTIEARHASAANRYIQSATLNGAPLGRWWLPQSAVLAGGSLVLELGPQPNHKWTAPPPPR